MPQQGTSKIRVIDTHQFAVPARGAAYLIEAPIPVLVETGTACAAALLLEAVRQHELQLVFVTHIHLDHAGSAGLLLEHTPEVQLGVHVRGAPHLERPERLIEGVRAASPDVFPLYGIPQPIDSDRMLRLEGGEQFDLGDGFLLEAIATPGHAPHHLCYFEHRTKTLFTGDAVGNWRLPVNVPLTVPPRFDLELGLASIQRLKQYNPRRLAFTHFGISDRAMEELDRYEQELLDWFEKLRHLRGSLEDEAVIAQILAEPYNKQLSTLDQSLVEMCIRGGLLSLRAV